MLKKNYSKIILLILNKFPLSFCIKCGRIDLLDFTKGTIFVSSIYILFFCLCLNYFNLIYIFNINDSYGTKKYSYI